MNIDSYLSSVSSQLQGRPQYPRRSTGNKLRPSGSLQANLHGMMDSSDCGRDSFYFEAVNILRLLLSAGTATGKNLRLVSDKVSWIG